MPKRVSGTVLAIGISIFIVVMVGIFLLINFVFGDRVDDVYAGEWAATMIIQHMEDHDGQWPDDWDDMEAAYHRIVEQERVLPFPLDDMKSRIVVEFDVDPAELVTRVDPPGDEGPFEVVAHTTGESRHWRGKNPNSEILRYLKVRQENGQPIGNADSAD